LDKLKNHKQLNKKDQRAQRFSYIVSFIADKILIFASYHPYFLYKTQSDGYSDKIREMTKTLQLNNVMKANDK